MLLPAATSDDASVVARVERHTPKGAEGRIIRVLERAQQHIVGRFEEDGRFGGHVIPFDKRVLHEIFIPPGDEAGARPGDMVLAEITRPPTATRNPSGRVLQRLSRGLVVPRPKKVEGDAPPDDDDPN